MASVSAALLPWISIRRRIFREAIFSRGARPWSAISEGGSGGERDKVRLFQRRSINGNIASAEFYFPQRPAPSGDGISCFRFRALFTGHVGWTQNIMN
jgi:hypothetical protein